MPNIVVKIYDTENPDIGVMSNLGTVKNIEEMKFKLLTQFFTTMSYALEEKRWFHEVFHLQ
jgi:hypothetical protein